MKPMAEAIGEDASGFSFGLVADAAMKPMAEAIGEADPMTDATGPRRPQ